MNKKYLNICDKEYFLEYINKNKSDCRVKKIKDKKIFFLTNFKINDEYINSYNRYEYYFKYYVLKHLTSIITIILCVIVFFVSGSFIKEIKFAEENEYNEQVYQDVHSYLIKKGPFYVLKDNLNKVSADLRQKYPEYAWIGITKNYSQLLIDIEYQDVPPKEDLDATYSCDLISKYDGIIKSIIVKKGVVLVMPNQSVKKGDILVSGNLNVETNPNNMEKLVKADGIIIGKTLVLEKIKIKKRQESLECTGRVKNVKVISFFNKTIGKNPLTFDAYYTKITPIFNLFNILEINNIAYYEQTIVENVYDEETALRFAESKVYQEFEKKRTSDLEKIEEIKLLEISDNDEYFIISFIVSKYVNFASIRQY